MAELRVWVFFYGSFMDAALLEQRGIVPVQIEVVRLPGYAISIGPLANLTPSAADCVYGVLVRLTHRELEHLYADLPSATGTLYLPDAVLVQTESGCWRPALSYVALPSEPAPPAPDYLEHILGAAREHRFPDWYLRRLEAFRA
jgi:cation transport regulator ChaC